MPPPPPPWVVVVVVVMRSDQPKPPAVAIVHQNGLSSDSCRASVAVTPVSRQTWWIQVVGGRPLARLHSCEGRSPSLVLVQIRRITTTMTTTTKCEWNTHTYLSASTFLGGLPRNRNLLVGISGISSGLTVEKNCAASSSFLINNNSTQVR